MKWYYLRLSGSYNKYDEIWFVNTSGNKGIAYTWLENRKNLIINVAQPYGWAQDSSNEAKPKDLRQLIRRVWQKVAL